MDWTVDIATHSFNVKCDSGISITPLGAEFNERTAHENWAARGTLRGSDTTHMYVFDRDELYELGFTDPTWHDRDLHARMDAYDRQRAVYLKRARKLHAQGKCTDRTLDQLVTYLQSL